MSKKKSNAFKIILFLLLLSAVLFSHQTGCMGTSEPEPETVPAPAEKTAGVPKLKPNEESIAVSRVTVALLTKMHYLKRNLSAENSKKFFSEYLKKIDPLHMFFTKEIISGWEMYAPNLIDDLLEGKPQFAFLVYNTYLDQLEKYREFSNQLAIGKNDLGGNESFDADRTKAEWPADERELKDVWRKKILNDVILLTILDRIDKEKQAKNPEKTKWAKASPLDQVKKRISLFVTGEKNVNSLSVMEHYLNALASLYDPHTEYMAPSTEEDFNINMSLSLFGIGAVLSTADDGSTKIVKIIPGGPAMKDGRLHAEDRIIAVAQGNKEPVDVIDMPLKKVVSLIRGPAGSEVVITALDAKDGTGGTPKTIRLIREEIELKDSEAQSQVRTVKGADGRDYRIAVITLPSFYFDFDGASAGKKDYRSSTRDVQKLIREIKRQGEPDAIVMDLRANGGGSLAEAIRLTGLFIPDGPVVQVLDADGEVDVEYDKDGGKVEYSGPLIVVTNRFSASASEIFAGAIQDHRRGIIVGDVRTHGKGSVQTMIDIGEYFRYLSLPYQGGSLKLTKSKFYRINGHSTQLKGVEPDIVIPSYTDVLEIGEARLDNPMPWDEIRPVIGARQNPLEHAIRQLKTRSQARIDADAEFKILKNDMERYRKNKEKKLLSLNLENRWKEYLEQKRVLDEQEAEFDRDNDSKKEKDIVLDEAVRITADFLDLTGKESTR